MTSEWSQRTALITFTLVPKRMRVMSAKFAAGVVLGVIVAGDRARRRGPRDARVGGEWTIGAAIFGQIVLLV